MFKEVVDPNKYEVGPNCDKSSEYPFAVYFNGNYVCSSMDIEHGQHVINELKDQYQREHGIERMLVDKLASELEDAFLTEGIVYFFGAVDPLQIDIEKENADESRFSTFVYLDACSTALRHLISFGFSLKQAKKFASIVSVYTGTFDLTYEGGVLYSFVNGEEK